MNYYIIIIKICLHYIDNKILIFYDEEIYIYTYILLLIHSLLYKISCYKNFISYLILIFFSFQNIILFYKFFK